MKAVSGDVTHFDLNVRGSLWLLSKPETEAAGGSPGQWGFQSLKRVARAGTRV